MKVIMLVVVLSSAVTVHTHQWERIPTKDGGTELYDTTRPLPELFVEMKDIIFQLYTLANPSKPQTLEAGGSYIGNFNVSKATKFVTHGWMNYGDDMSDIRDGWLQAGDYNVIVIDWSVHAENWNYAQAKAAVKAVGKLVATFINWLACLGAVTNNMQLAGHSLGAHVCGVAGSFVTAGRLNRITGLDPAAPLFTLEPTENRLDASDASFVQVIHTNGGLLGWKDLLGTVDFYPNGGSLQPGCGLDIGGACSHARSFYLFAESITTRTGFKAHQCRSWNDYISGNCADNPTALMGEMVPKSASGTYYLATADSSPYALDEKATI